MKIRFTCPSCGERLRAAPEREGKTSKCPSCQSKVVVPPPAIDAEIIDDDVQIVVEDSDPGYVLEASKEDDRRPCPICGELILRKAAKCRYCGEIFDKSLKRMTSRKRHDPEDEDLTTGEWLAALLCSGFACIFGLIWTIQGKPKGKKMLAISFLAGCFWTVVRILLEIAAHSAKAR